MLESKPLQPAILLAVLAGFAVMGVAMDYMRTSCDDDQQMYFVARSWLAMPLVGHSYEVTREDCDETDAECAVKFARSGHWQLKTSAGASITRANLLDPIAATWTIASAQITGRISRKVGLYGPYYSEIGGQAYESAKGWLWGREFWHRNPDGTRTWAAFAERFMRLPFTPVRWRVCVSQALPAEDALLGILATLIVSDIQNDDKSNDNRR